MLCQTFLPKLASKINCNKTRIYLFPVPKPESTEKMPIKAKFKVVKKQVLVEPAKTVEEIIPEETMVIKKQVLVKDETTVEEEVPAVYTEVKKQVLVKQGGLTVWKEVPCDVSQWEKFFLFSTKLEVLNLQGTLSKSLMRNYINS
ncbi:MAG: hypothetical protein ACI81T_003539 [Bacteroidia bacterium]